MIVYNVKEEPPFFIVGWKINDTTYRPSLHYVERGFFYV